MKYFWIVIELTQILIYWFYIFVVILQRYEYLKSDKCFEKFSKFVKMTDQFKRRTGYEKCHTWYQHERETNTN